MEYKKKIEYAERVARELQAGESSDSIKSALKGEGLYDRDISSVMVSARNVLGESYQASIREYLLEGKDVSSAAEFSILDKEMLEKLVSKEVQSLATGEQSKITKLIKEGLSGEEVFGQVDTRFLPAEKAAEQINSLLEVRKQNSGSGRMINIGGGIGLIILTGLVMVGTGRIFYILPIIGLIIIVKGVTTKSMKYSD